MKSVTIARLAGAAVFFSSIALAFHFFESTSAKLLATAVILVFAAILSEHLFRFLTRIQETRSVDGPYSPMICLYRDASVNRIKAAPVVTQDGEFPGALTYLGQRYAGLPEVLTFWDHLSVDGKETSPVQGITLNLFAPNDSPLIESPFCTANPTNITISAGDVRDIALGALPSSYESDCAQAFGSRYYSNGNDVLMVLGRWAGVQYDFPLEAHVIATELE